MPLHLGVPHLENEGMSDFLFSLAEPVQGSTIDVLQIGSYDSTRYGKFKVTRDDFDAYIEEFKTSNASGRRQVDFDHKGSQGDTRAAGWIKDLHIDGDKLKANVEWTPAGRAAVEGKEYRFTSAEYTTAERSKTTGKTVPLKKLKAVTLTNRPFIDTMDPVSLSDDPSARLAVLQLNSAEPAPDDGGSTNRRKLEAGPEGPGGSSSGDHNLKTRKHMSDLHKLLKLSEDADETAVIEAVKALAEKPKETEGETVSLADFMTLSERVQTAEKANKDLLRDMYLSDAVRVGRVAPSELVADKGEPALITIFNASPEAAKAMIEARPINKMLSEIGGSEEALTSGERKLGADDIWSKNQTGGREGLDLRARQLMAEDKTLDYGDALIAAEREAVA